MSARLVTLVHPTRFPYGAQRTILLLLGPSSENVLVRGTGALPFGASNSRRSSTLGARVMWVVLAVRQIVPSYPRLLAANRRVPLWLLGRPVPVVSLVLLKKQGSGGVATAPF